MLALRARFVRFFSFCIAVIVYGIFSSQVADAALLYIDPAEAQINRGDTKTIAVRLDTDEGECINTVDAVIEYDSSVRAVDVSRGDSILSLWIEDPVIDEEQNKITFAGGIPGGYCGRIAGDPRLSNIIVELVFRSPGLNIGGGNNPNATIVFTDETQVLEHDGFGSRAPLQTRGATITLLDSVGTALDDSWTARVQNDTMPPADFVITLAQNEDAFSGNYFITFNTTDKQSGIDHYEVMEEPFEEFYLFKWGGVDAPWTVTESPYVLNDQDLNSTIRVKALDKAGNERIVTFIPDSALRSRSFERTVVFGILGVVLLIAIVLVLYALWRRKQALIQTYTRNTHDHEERS